MIQTSLLKREVRPLHKNNSLANTAKQFTLLWAFAKHKGRRFDYTDVLLRTSEVVGNFFNIFSSEIVWAMIQTQPCPGQSWQVIHKKQKNHEAY
jgi:hypothetical protein